MITLGKVLQLSCDYIKSKKLSQGRLEVEHLIAHILGLKRLDLYLRFEQPLDEAELELIRKALSRLVQGEPLAYIEGTVSFFNGTFDVDKRVLIPRPETEQMVEHVVQTICNLSHEKMTLWDVCTGSGCIGIAIKKACPWLDVTLSDISQDALALASNNAKKNGVEIACVQGNLLEPCQGQQVDFIVCNPPYITEHDFQTLDDHVKNFEPKLALVSGPNGYECYEAIAKTLSNKTVCWLEFGVGQGENIAKLFDDRGFKNIKTFFDYSGHSRFLEIQVK